MPKNSSEFLTGNFGFITDYLAEAFHYLFQHTNRYEEVSKHIRLGAEVEGRDEKGIKKTVCALLKILHPAGRPSDEEFEEYVAYAVECRRRIKEQMNKRKPDVEFAKINLSYFNASGEETVVYCPESEDAAATQNPARRSLNEKGLSILVESKVGAAKDLTSAVAVSETAENKETAITPEKVEQEPQEQHFTIYYGATGYSYESIIAPYLQGAKEVLVEDPYIRAIHQAQNFVRLCEIFVKSGEVKKITLITSFDDDTPLADMQSRLDDLKQSLLEADVILDVHLNPDMHDREIRLDNGWVIKIGRGLDFYQKPSSWFEIGALDLTLRKCLETKIDIYKV
jgi:ATP-dependent Lon protease